MKSELHCCVTSPSETPKRSLHVLTPREIAAVKPGTDPMSFPLPDNALA
jgi:hypothetical protein